MEQEAYRHIPRDIDVEQALLGAILKDNRAMERASALLTPEHFYDPLHGRIFATILRMIVQDGIDVTPLTLHANMKSDPGVIETGGLAYFEAMRAAAPALPNIKAIADIVADLATRRDLIRIGEDIVNRGYDPPNEINSAQMIEEATNAIGYIAEQVRRLSPHEPYCLSLADWLSRDIPPADYLLGELFSTTSRVMLIAERGLGKTNFALAMAFAMADGVGFQHWRGGRRARVLFIDGEMSRRVMKKRLADATRRHGSRPETLFILSREDVEDMPPLNTAAGQAYIDALIKELGGVDFIFFDNVQSLLVGDMKEEEAWEDTLPWIKRLTKRRIGQCWVHHTGWETSRGYGTSTREWQMDTVAIMEAVEGSDSDIAFSLKFTKARERDPTNRADFEPVVITLGNDQWSVKHGKLPTKSGALTSGERGWLADITDLFAAPGAAQMAVPTPGMPPVLTLTREQVRNGLKRKGRFSADHNEPLMQAHRTKLSTALNSLKDKGKICMTDKFVWLMQEGQ
jgi:AAA domain/DnaB-like helicase N terminal domain